MSTEIRRKLSASDKEYIVAEYKKLEKTYQEIANDLGLKKQTVSDYIRRSLKNGELEMVDRKKFRNEKIKEAKESNTVRTLKKVEHNPEPNTDVNCNKVYRTCIYGCSGSSGHCNFQACIGRSRIFTSPDPKHCHDYIRATKNRPRIIKVTGI